MTSLGRPVDVNLSVGSIGTGHLKGTTTVNANSGQVNVTGTFTHGEIFKQHPIASDYSFFERLRGSMSYNS